MNVTQITRNTIAAAALITLGISTNAVAETQTVTRGPNGAASIVKKVSLDAQQQLRTQSRAVPSVTKKGPNGAAHIVKTQSAMRNAATPTGQVITRGPNGAAFITN